MYDTPLNERVKNKILSNTNRHIMNLNYLNGSGLQHNYCSHCGNSIFHGGKGHGFKDIMNDIKQVGNYLKPVAKPILHAITDKAITGIESGGAIKKRGRPRLGQIHNIHLKGSESITHPGELDYTTKKNDLVHHINGQYVYENILPYGNKLSSRKPRGSGIKIMLKNEAKSLAKPVIKTVMIQRYYE